MQRFSPGRAPGAVCLLLLATLMCGRALAVEPANQNQPLGDLSAFRAIAADTLAIVNTGKLARAKARIKDLETKWDGAEAKLRPRNPERWRTIDKAIDAALMQLRADKPQASAAKGALQDLLTSLDRPDQPAAAAAGTTAAVESAKLSVTDIIAAAEKLQAGASVLDVSFEPKDGQPIYAVRTYANGKVWDGLLDGTSGAALDHGTVVDESALDAEDRAELAALKAAKITLRQAVASAEKANGGRALNAGLEQVRGRAVWEILIPNTTQPQSIHIDPKTGKIL
jgi:uncharacterized membrane protein YkoI